MKELNIFTLTVIVRDCYMRICQDQLNGPSPSKEVCSAQESQDHFSLRVTLSKDRARPIFRRAHLPKKVYFIIIPEGNEGYSVFRGTPLSISRSHCYITKALPCSLGSCPPWEVEDREEDTLEGPISVVWLSLIHI